MAAKRYEILNPADNPDAVTPTAIPPRKPKAGSPVKASHVSVAGVVVPPPPVHAPAKPIPPTTVEEFGSAQRTSSPEPTAGAAQQLEYDERMDEGLPPPPRGSSAEMPAPSRAVPDVQHTRVSFELSGGVYSVPAIAVIPGRFGVLVLLPADGNQASFVPSPGTTLGVRHDKESWRCYFPGTEFDLDQPRAKVLVFILTENE